MRLPTETNPMPDPYFIQGFLLCAVLYTLAVIAVALYLERVHDVRVSTAEEDVPDEWFPVDGEVYVRCDIDGQLERVTGAEEEGEVLVLETRSTGRK